MRDKYWGLNVYSPLLYMYYLLRKNFPFSLYEQINFHQFGTLPMIL